MLRKVEQLVSVGKFRNYQASGDVSFAKLTLIYAENGTGKTTLAAVVRSLTHGKPEIVTKRISTNHTSPQAAHLIQRDAAGNDTHHTLGAAGWSNPFPGIEVFDVHFVNENVYSGFEFRDDHRQQLHEFVIGAQGVTIKRLIEENKTAKAALRQKQEVLENQIISQVGCGLTPELMTTFCRTPAADAANIDPRIAAAQSALDNAKANSFIQTLPFLSPIARLVLTIDFDGVRTDLAATAETIQNQTLRELFANHCAELASNGINNPEIWIKTGVGFMENGSAAVQCPFCRQPVSDDLDIVQAYKMHFNAVLNELVRRIDGHLSVLRGIDVGMLIQGLRNAEQTNADRIASWARHLPTAIQCPVLNMAEDEAALLAAFQNLDVDLNRKCSNPCDTMAATAAGTLQALLNRVNQTVTGYNAGVEAYNNAVTAFRAGIQTEVTARNDLERLQRIRKRFEASVNDLCNQLDAEKHRLKSLEDAYPQLIEQQQAAASAFFTSYKDRINHYLGTVFRTPFSVTSVDHVPPRGRATQSKIDYKLMIDGHEISNDPARPNSVKECLSEGDKSTIAFAFFLAKLDIDPGKADKMLVIDDPLSSFDSNRRLYTAQVIKGLLTEMKQVVVLSHNEFFLFDLYKDAPRAERKTLRISENLANRSSSIEPLDLESLVQGDYFKHIHELEAFLASPDIAEKERVLGLMRNVLEAHIGFKFHRQTCGIPASSRTFGRLIDELERQRVVFRQDTTPPSIIKTLRMINAVSCKPHHGEPTPDYRALGCDPNNMTTIELGNLVKDTFQLIDDRL